MSANLKYWMKTVFGWALLGFVAYFIPMYLITASAWKEVAESAIIPFWVTVIAFPFSLVFGVLGGWAGLKISTKKWISVICACVGGMFAPILIYVYFRVDLESALSLISFLSPAVAKIFEIISE